MSDAPEYLPPYARSSRGADVPVKPVRVQRDDDLDDDADADELDRDDDERPSVPPAERAPVREGLPPTYRMRHEAHYVEALVSPPARPEPPAAAPPPAAEAVTAPAPVTEPAPGGMGPAVAALSEALESIQASLREVSQRGRPLRDRVAVDLARAEATRARWLADAATVLQTDPLPSLDEVDLVAVCRAVAEAFAPEYRLSGGAPALSVPSSAVPVFGDERLLTGAVGSILAAVRALVDDRGDASRVAVTVTPRVDAANRTVQITQTAVRLPAAAYGRFFDASWTAHPAGATAALMLAAAHRIAVAHGGALELSAVEGGGCRLSLSVPAVG